MRETAGSDDTFYLYGPGDVAYAQIADDTTTTTYLHHDQLGSIRLLTDASGTTTGTVTYDAYGTVAASSGTLSHLGYAGQYTDGETSFQYLRARYYDPATGQFLSRDPLFSITRSAYGYTGADPLDFKDEAGLAEHYANLDLTLDDLLGWDCDQLLNYMGLLTKELASRDTDFVTNKHGFGYKDRRYAGHVERYDRVQALLGRVREAYDKKCDDLTRNQERFVNYYMTKDPADLGHPGKRPGHSVLGQIWDAIPKVPFLPFLPPIPVPVA